MAKMINIGQLILNRYRVEDYLADGGQALIVLAQDEQTGKQVVVKQLHESFGDPGYDTALARFNRMAQIQLNHPNVVDPIDSGEEDSEHYLVMPYYDGCNLTEHLAAEGGKLDADEAVLIAVEIAAGLAAIHDNGIVHRDIKPPNILITSDRRVLITDLGICRVLNQQTITAGSDLMGTLQWMSPEQVTSPGSEDHRCDLYSLGVVLYRLLTGQATAQGTSPAEVLRSICWDVPPSPRVLDSAIPEHISQACMRLLVKQREGRFQSAQEFIQAVQGVPQQASGSFCLSCGANVPQGAKFCSSCGASLDGSLSNRTQCIACGSPVNGSEYCPGCNMPFSQRNHRLECKTGPLTGLTLLIPEGIHVVGRNELAPRDHHISRKHLSLACLNEKLIVQDAGSTNKTFVNGREVAGPVALQPGQELVIAGNTAVYTRN